MLVDSSAALALLNRRDQWHLAAGAALKQLVDRQAVLIMTNFLLAETHALLLTRMGRAIAREVAELGKPVDILMSADYMVINNLIIPEHADWNAVFAVNSMVIMYTDQSEYADEISEDNWYEVLVREGVQYGHSEPDMDPCGYRSVLLFQLAENYYQKEGLNQALLAARSSSAWRNGCPAFERRRSRR